jgi:hypothetical protein
MKSLYFLIMVFFITVVVSCVSPSECPNPVAPELQKGLELVIANSEYQSGHHLDHVIDDALNIECALKSFCFDVTLRTDLNKDNMKDAIKDFVRDLGSQQTPNIGLFYFMGHGASSENEESFLLPTNDADINNTNFLEDYAISVDWILKQISIKDTKSIIILDACYVNPYSISASENLCSSTAKIKSQADSFKRGPMKWDFRFAFPSNGAVSKDKELYNDTLVNVLKTIQNKSIAHVFETVKAKMDDIPRFWGGMNFTFKKECPANISNGGNTCVGTCGGGTFGGY